MAMAVLSVWCVMRSLLMRLVFVEPTKCVLFIVVLAIACVCLIVRVCTFVAVVCDVLLAVVMMRVLMMVVVMMGRCVSLLWSCIVARE